MLLNSLSKREGLKKSQNGLPNKDLNESVKTGRCSGIGERRFSVIPESPRKFISWRRLFGEAVYCLTRILNWWENGLGRREALLAVFRENPNIMFSISLCRSQWAIKESTLTWAAFSMILAAGVRGKFNAHVVRRRMVMFTQCRTGVIALEQSLSEEQWSSVRTSEKSKIQSFGCSASIFKIQSFGCYGRIKIKWK